MNSKELEIEASSNWIKDWVTPVKGINKKFSAYKLKDTIEKSAYGKICHRYISEENFIEAAKNLGYSFKNGFFNMSFKKIMVNPIQYQLFFGGGLKQANKSGNIKWPKK